MCLEMGQMKLKQATSPREPMEEDWKRRKPMGGGREGGL